MPKPVTKEDLERLSEAGCQTPGCKHDHAQTLYVHAQCHPSGKIEVSYTRGSGFIHIACGVCGQIIADIAVAERQPSAYALAE
jgi:ribosomal protein S27E